MDKHLMEIESFMNKREEKETFTCFHYLRLRKRKMILFGLDGTILNKEKTITSRTLKAIDLVRKCDYLVGVCTMRNQETAEILIKDMNPDVLICSGGSLVKIGKETLFKSCFSVEETNQIIHSARINIGFDVEIAIDTPEKRYWNYKVDPCVGSETWFGSVWTDYHDFHYESLNICLQIPEEDKAREYLNQLDCETMRFGNSDWYRLMKKGTNKARSLRHACDFYQMELGDVTFIGNDESELDLFGVVGKKIAVSNASEKLKRAADLIVPDNDSEGVAQYLEDLAEKCSGEELV